MLFNQETDYAIRIVAFLAEQKSKCDAKTIALKTGVTERFTLKILHRLVKSGIAKSYKGSKGGYTLAKPPESITLLEVIEDICGELEFSRCQGDGNCCTHPQGMCRFYSVFDGASRNIREQFASVNFAVDNNKITN